jgi:Kef-type K+ transport system membrane component KefB
VVALVAVLVVLVAGAAGGSLASALRQPSVVGQMAAGLLIGPLAFGTLAPGLSEQLFPADAKSVIRIIGSLSAGTFLFLTAAARHSAAASVRRDAGILAAANGASAVGAAAVATAVLPALAGIRLSAVESVFLVGALAMCALPVLMRIMESRGLTHTRAGRCAVAVGVATDVVVWSGVVVLASISGSRSAAAAVGTVGLVAVIILAWPLLRAVVALLLDLRRGAVTSLLVAGGCAAAGVTLAVSVSLDPLLGALAGGMLFGAGTGSVRGETVVRPRLLDAIGKLNSALLLPIFFASAGFAAVPGTALGAIAATTALMTALAVLTRVVGTAAAGRWCTLSRTQAATVCALICSRGATEIALLRVGSELHLLPSALYSPMALMALATTIISGVATASRHVVGDAVTPSAASAPVPDVPADVRPPARAARPILLGFPSFSV